MELITRSITDEGIRLIEYKPTIKVVVERIEAYRLKGSEVQLSNCYDKHKFNCEVINSNCSENFLRFMYVGNYENLSKPDKHGKVARDIATAKGGYDTSFNTDRWDVEISLSERKV